MGRKKSTTDDEEQQEEEECSFKSTRIPYVDPQTSANCLILLQHAYKTFNKKGRYRKELRSTLLTRPPGVRAPLCDMMDAMISHAERKLRNGKRDHTTGKLLKRQIIIHSSSDITDFDFEETKTYATKLSYSFELCN